ncbi:Uncharacterized ACR, COG1753 [Halorubrum xinjiangense]|uniref:Uncharacterized ACR, COG1753 n=1 Tax=Halorubrum xinjiangense TaxID=261291 RepID=A0A1G7N5I9_9EURY|nr:antitoxin VapB family protein [Halorubrum xinjiangense]SDF69303.1 Uncharacterized ACR, COG1753 [Halorubrum xinjiangense]
MAKRIGVGEETYDALASLKRDDETFDDLLTRLLRERREDSRSGASFWKGSDAPEHARETRQELKSGSDTRGSEP